MCVCMYIFMWLQAHRCHSVCVCTSQDNLRCWVTLSPLFETRWLVVPGYLACKRLGALLSLPPPHQRFLEVQICTRPASFIGSQRLKKQSQACMELHQILSIHAVVVQLGVFVNPCCLPALGTLFLLLGWLIQPCHEGLCLVLCTLICWEACFFFLKENGGAMTIGEGNSGRSGGRGDCRGKVLYERRINIKEKEEI